jgi:hypothetical protein
VLTLDTNIQNNYFMFDCSIYKLFVLNTVWKLDSLQTMLFVYICSTWSVVQTINAFWDVNNQKWHKCLCLFHLPYLITLMVYLCSQWTLNVNIKYFMSDWSIYRLFVLNRAWKLDSFQIMIFVYICSTWGIVELKTRLETWIRKMT